MQTALFFRAVCCYNGKESDDEVVYHLKKYSIFFVLLSCLFFTACGRTTELVSQVHEMEGAGKQIAMPELKDKETLAMQNFMIPNRYTTDGNRIFGTRHSAETGMPSLWSMSQKMKRADLLDEYCDASFLTISGDYLYYLRTDVSTQERSICRVRKDGSEKPESLFRSAGDSLQLLDDTLYFTDKSHRLLAADADGRNQRTICDDYEIYIPYVIGDDLFFQNGDDAESLWKLSFNTGKAVKITDGPVYEYYIEDGNLYTDLGDLGWKPGEREACQYCGSNLEISYLYDEEMKVESIELFFAETKETIVIPPTE